MTVSSPCPSPPIRQKIPHPRHGIMGGGIVGWRCGMAFYVEKWNMENKHKKSRPFGRLDLQKIAYGDRM